MGSNVRLTEITIQNFKNVIKGNLSFTNKRKQFHSSVLALYGQNGSGKTALIDALQMLKFALCGASLPKEAADYINTEKKAAKLTYVFNINTESGTFEVEYSFKLQRDKAPEVINFDTAELSNENNIAVISDEVLKYSFTNQDLKIRKNTAFDTRTKNVFLPAAKFECMVGKEEETAIDLLIAKKLAYKTSRSFIFSSDLLKAVQKQQHSEDCDDGCKRCYELLSRLIYYGNTELFVVSTANYSFIGMDILPLAFKIKDIKRIRTGIIPLPLNKSAVLPEYEVNIADKLIAGINVVLQQLVPHLTIGLKHLDMRILKNGQKGVNVQLVSYKNNQEIALKYESEGIKKIISILQLLILVYNQTSVTVAVDELDSGIFEYLLGEILRIISEKGKGQLIFTSHNLRPLETIDRGFIAFTSTDPEKRYVRFQNVKSNNNLRNLYYRDITLSDKKIKLYEFISYSEIVYALKEAYEVNS